jgi:hypothetical protein
MFMPKTDIVFHPWYVHRPRDKLKGELGIEAKRRRNIISCENSYVPSWPSDRLFSMCETNQLRHSKINGRKPIKKEGCFSLYFSCIDEAYQFYSVLFRIIETFHINLKNKTKWNNFHFILNLGSFWIFQLNFSRNVLISFHMFCFGLEKPLNQIKSGSI